MKKYSMKAEKGFTLLELMITIFVIAVGLVGIMTLIQNTLQSASIVRLNLTAAYLAQEGIELTRNIRDNNWIKGEQWETGLTHCSSGSVGCKIQYSDDFLSIYDDSYLKVDSNGYYGYESGQESRFRRKVIIEVELDYLEIRSEVFWEEKGETQSIEVIERLYNWR